MVWLVNIWVTFNALPQVKLQSCPSCKKPLPRCAVCLVNMGTASGTTLLTSAEGQDKVGASGNFGGFYKEKYPLLCYR